MPAGLFEKPRTSLVFWHFYSLTIVSRLVNTKFLKILKTEIVSESIGFVNNSAFKNENYSAI
jgi:hypothetical protein